MATFIVHNGKLKGQRINLGPGQFLLGRDVRCPICIPSDRVSRMHCEFEVGSTTVALRDVGSRNGTIVNGEKIVDTVHLNAGDIVDIGPMRLELETATPTKRVGSIAPHVADGAQVSDSIMDWLKQDSQSSMSETKLSLPSLSALDTPEKKFTDVAEEGADIIQRHLDSLKAKESQSESDTV